MGLSLLNNPSYRENAVKVQAAIQKSKGVDNAANIIEKVLQREALLYSCRQSC